MAVAGNKSGELTFQKLRALGASSYSGNNGRHVAFALTCWVTPLHRRANAMNPRFRGRIGEYLWEKERERLKRYKDRPWELRSKEPRDNPLFSFLIGLESLLAYSSSLTSSDTSTYSLSLAAGASRPVTIALAGQSRRVVWALAYRKQEIANVHSASPKGPEFSSVCALATRRTRDVWVGMPTTILP